MARTNLTPEAKAAQSIINKLTCMHEAQLEYFLPPLKEGYVKKNRASSVAAFLHFNKMAERVNEYIYPYAMQKHSISQIDSTWTMIDMISKKHQTEYIGDFIHCIMSGDSPVDICYIDETGKTLKIMAIINEANVSMLAFEQNRFYTNTKCAVGEEAKTNTEYVIVIRDIALLDSIADLSLTIPHKIALLDYSAGVKPNVRYFE